MCIWLYSVAKLPWDWMDVCLASLSSSDVYVGKNYFFSPIGIHSTNFMPTFYSKQKRGRKEMKYNTLPLQHSIPLSVYLCGIEISKEEKQSHYIVFWYALTFLFCLLRVMHNLSKILTNKTPLIHYTSPMFDFLSFKEPVCVNEIAICIVIQCLLCSHFLSGSLVGERHE